VKKLLSCATIIALLAVLGGCSSSSSTSTTTTVKSTIQTLEPGVLKVCLYPGFPPFATQASDGTWSGWDVEFLQGFAKQQGLTLQPVVATQFDNIWMRPGNNECDIAGTGISNTAARVAQTGSAAQWSDRYYTVDRSFAVKKGTVVNGITDLAGRTVIVTKNSAADIDVLARLAQASITNTTVTYVDDEATGAKQVAAAGPNGPVAYGGGTGSIQTLVQQIPGLELAWEHCLMLPGGTISSEPFNFVVRTASAGLLSALNAFIAAPTPAYPGGLGSGRDCPTGS